MTSEDVQKVLGKYKGQELNAKTKSKIYDELDKLHKQELIYQIIADFKEKIKNKCSCCGKNNLEDEEATLCEECDSEPCDKCHNCPHICKC